MGRLMWMTIGAIGGILVYRKVVVVADQAREQGLALTAQQGAVAANRMFRQVSNSIGARVSAAMDSEGEHRSSSAPEDDHRDRTPS